MCNSQIMYFLKNSSVMKCSSQFGLVRSFSYVYVTSETLFCSPQCLFLNIKNMGHRVHMNQHKDHIPKCPRYDGKKIWKKNFIWATLACNVNTAFTTFKSNYYSYSHISCSFGPRFAGGRQVPEFCKTSQ